MSWEHLDTYHLSKFTFGCKSIKKLANSAMGLGCFGKCELLLRPYISSMSGYLEVSPLLYNLMTKGLGDYL